jgi:hypothetical protein
MKLTHIYQHGSLIPYAAYYAMCLVYDHYDRPLALNYKLHNYAVDNGIIFG